MLDIFQYPDIKFPESFLWGASTAGQQIEGNNCSQLDDAAFRPKVNTFDGKPYIPAGRACNSYELYMEDIGLLEQMGLSLYRMSVEWCRIEPEKGHYDEKALAHYITVLEELNKRNIRVCLTLHHVTHPVWFHRQGHFDTLDSLADWERYLNYIVPKLDPYVDFWIILNELNLPYTYTLKQRLNMVRYHAVGYHTVKKHSAKPASSAHSYSGKWPLRGKHDRLDNLVADYVDYVENEFFFHAIRTGEVTAPFQDGGYVDGVKDTCDFWAMNTYVRHMIDGRKADYLTGPYTATHFQALDTPFYTEEICPEIMIDMLLRVKDKPILITENGLAARDDRLRIVYISAMLQGIRQAMDLGADVLGYSHWTLVDNWEWGTWAPNFGLAEMDRETCERRLKKQRTVLRRSGKAKRV